jgi:N-ethylmaleimide reductase
VTPKLLTPLNLGALDLGHRMVSPGTGWDEAGRIVPPPGLATLSRKASPGGLVISHPLPVSPRGRFHPVCHGTADLDRCRRMAATIHAGGAAAVAQLAHAGRLAHSSLTGHAPLAPDRIAARCMVHAAGGAGRPAEAPEPLDLAGIDALVAAYAAAASAARAAGFDAIEVSAAEGGLLDQFLHDGSNHRTDAYGAGPAGRCQLLWEVLEAVRGSWGADRVGVRLSPFGRLHDMHDTAPIELFAVVLHGLSEREVAFVHLAGTGACPGAALYGADGAKRLRAAIAWPLIVSGPFTAQSGLAIVASRWADAVGFDDMADGPALLDDLRRTATPH